MRSLFFIHSIIFLSGMIHSNEEHAAILANYINTDNLCIGLDSRINADFLIREKVRFFFDFFWNTITNHEIFKRMIEDDISDFSYNNVSVKLKNAFLENLSLKEPDEKYLDALTVNETRFKDEMLRAIFVFYDMLRICFKDTMSKTMAPLDAMKILIRENTCFIKGGISSHLPSFVYKLCNKASVYYNQCPETVRTDDNLKAIHYNNEVFDRGECLNNHNIELQNFNTNFTAALKDINNVINAEVNDVGESSYYLWIVLPVILMFFVIICIFSYLGFIYYKKRDRKQWDEAANSSFEYIS
ncbi:putative SP-containing membrane protein [Vairimorpha necatrix]|uniref:SP-containing membrane protein n=1 Tax=Vairimorpha necatrix TaxID=6039 RepID=A0AAX4JCN7_9MICR